MTGTVTHHRSVSRSFGKADHLDFFGLWKTAFGLRACATTEAVDAWGKRVPGLHFKGFLGGAGAMQGIIDRVADPDDLRVLLTFGCVLVAGAFAGVAAGMQPFLHRADAGFGFKWARRQ